jgi:isocitrate dehydrogenase
MDGDEMAQDVFKMVKNNLIYPYLDLNIEYFDFSCNDSQITAKAIDALKRTKVGIKCPSKESTQIGTQLNGTVFHEPIMVKNIPRLIPTWTEPIIMAVQ